MSEQDGTHRIAGPGAIAQAAERSENAADDRSEELERTFREFQRALDRDPTERYVMRLYIAGNSIRSRAAIENVRRICSEYLCGRCDLEVIDLYQDENRAQEDSVIAAPTLVKYEPLPRSRIIGDMTRTEKLLAGLGLIPRPG